MLRESPLITEYLGSRRSACRRISPTALLTAARNASSTSAALRRLRVSQPILYLRPFPLTVMLLISVRTPLGTTLHNAQAWSCNSRGPAPTERVHATANRNSARSDRASTKLRRERLLEVAPALKRQLGSTCISTERGDRTTLSPIFERYPHT